MKFASLAMVVAFAFSAAGTSFAQHTPKAKGQGQGQGQAQTQPTPAPAPSSAPAAPAQPGWAARCSSPSRDAPLECAMEQNAIFTKTGQLVVLVNIRVPGDTRAPILLVQMPLGLNLPAGIKLQIDEGKLTDLPIQTCESRGCYATIPLPADVLAALRSGQQMKLSFQTMNKEPVVIPMPLGDFAAAYDKIK